MGHPTEADKFLKNEERVNWHDQTLWFVRHKRDLATKSIEEWEELRETAAAIKAHVLSHLDTYLIQFEENARKNGIKVHWAETAEEHNRIVHDILRSKGAKKVVKSKSMLTEDCHLNQYLKKKNIEVIDTDLGERIVQLRKERPSHIVLPAIHLKKEEVGELFHQTLGTEKGISDPQILAAAARKDLRKHFLTADAAISGVNFAVAETGGIVICTNEGNADLGIAATPVHIACMGIEKLIPKTEHLGYFLRLLARSATGQAITAYSSHFNKPAPKKEMHIVILDMGRSEQLSRPDFRKSLNCIRCGACMNTCPVYRRSGGHSYKATVPGPIGSILSPGLDLKKYSTLPFASTLCGSCSDVCPVKIDIHEQLYKWRQVIAENNAVSFSKKVSMKLASILLSKPVLYRTTFKVFRKLVPFLPSFLLENQLNPWTKGRSMLPVPKESFTEWYQKNLKEKKK